MAFQKKILCQVYYIPDGATEIAHLIGYIPEEQLINPKDFISLEIHSLINNKISIEIICIPIADIPKIYSLKHDEMVYSDEDWVKEERQKWAQEQKTFIIA